MKPLCFLVEHENAGKTLSPPLQAGMTERLRFSAHFWCSDVEPHVLKVLAHRPDDTVCTVAALTGTCPNPPGVLVIRGLLDPLGAAGWHRLHMDLDGLVIGQSTPIFITGPRADRPSRYIERDEPLPEKARDAPAVPPSTLAAGGQRPRQR